MRNLWLLFLLMVLPSPAWSTIIDQQEWDVLPSGNWSVHNAWGIDPAAGSPSGGGAMRLDMSAGLNGNGTPSLGGNYQISNAGVFNEIWTGFWIKYSANFVYEQVGTKIAYYVYYPSPSGPGSTSHAAVTQLCGSLQCSPGGNGQIWDRVSQDWNDCCGDLHGSYILIPGKWYWIQQHIILGTPGTFDGTWQTWIGDPTTGQVQLTVNRSNVGFRGPSAPPGFDYFLIGLLYGGGLAQTPAQSEWIDHTVFATTQAETKMPGGSDSTPPPAPLGLKVQ